MQIGDNLHEMSNPVLGEKYFSMLSVEFAERVVKVNMSFICDI